LGRAHANWTDPAAANTFVNMLRDAGRSQSLGRGAGAPDATLVAVLVASSVESARAIEVPKLEILTAGCALLKRLIILQFCRNA